MHNNSLIQLLTLWFMSYFWLFRNLFSLHWIIYNFIHIIDYILWVKKHRVDFISINIYILKHSIYNFELPSKNVPFCKWYIWWCLYFCMLMKHWAFNYFLHFPISQVKVAAHCVFFISLTLRKVTCFFLHALSRCISLWAYVCRGGMFSICALWPGF